MALWLDVAGTHLRKWVVVLSEVLESQVVVHHDQNWKWKRESTYGGLSAKVQANMCSEYSVNKYDD